MLPEVTDFCRLVVCRHPELAPEAQGRVIGAGPAALGRRGQDTVLSWLRALASLRVDAVFSAEGPQCKDPASAIAASKGLEVATDERLLDQDMGAWQGRTWEEVAREDGERVREFFEELGERTPPGGESLGEAVERVLSWWGSVAPVLVGRTALLVAPGGLIAGYGAAMLGMRLSRSMSLGLPYGGIGILDVFANGARLSAWNLLALEGAAPSRAT